MKGHSARAIALAGYLAMALLFGGSASGGSLGHWLLQASAVMILAALLLRRDAADEPLNPALSRFAALALLLVVSQLIPLPPGIALSLPGRETVARGLALLGADPPWMSVSLAPLDTVWVGMWLLPPLAGLLLALRARTAEAVALPIVVGFACLSFVLGLSQRLAGEGSPLYLYEQTNADSAVGFFSNRNHLATLLLIALPCVAALLGNRKLALNGLVIAATIAALLVFGLAVTKSDAGVGLALPALLASLAVHRNLRASPGMLAAVAAAGVAAVLVLMALTPLFQTELSGYQSRGEIFATTLRAIADFFPAGSGLGSFRAVYRLYEDPSAVTSIYVIHVHNDYLEIALEAGLAGIGLVAAFLAWWAVLTMRIWQSDNRAAKAASVVTGIMLVHSLVDFPLRTPAHGVLFATFLAIMTVAAAAPAAPSSRRGRGG